MTLAKLLTEQQVITDMEATERWSAIVELMDQLVASGRVRESHREDILADLKKREESMSTGIGFGVAIPHTSSIHVGSVVAAFGRSRKGIDFEALDNAPVHFVVLFVVPKDEFQTHLRTLAAIAKFLNDRKIRESLAEAEDASAILGIFGANGGDNPS